MPFARLVRAVFCNQLCADLHWHCPFQPVWAAHYSYGLIPAGAIPDYKGQLAKIKISFDAICLIVTLCMTFFALAMKKALHRDGTGRADDGQSDRAFGDMVGPALTFATFRQLHRVLSKITRKWLGIVRQPVYRFGAAPWSFSRKTNRGTFMAQEFQGKYAIVTGGARGLDLHRPVHWRSGG